MSKNWSLILIVAFVLGFGLKSYLDLQNENKPEKFNTDNVVLFGENNQSVALFDQQDTRIRVAYFGFTRCPDVCPTSLAMLAGALNQIDDATKSLFRPVFISIDPERDAAADAHQYAQYFHPMIEGLSAPMEVTKPLADKYGVIFRKTELENSQLEYTVDHSSYFYFLKPDGTLITKVPHTLTPAPLVEAFTTLIHKDNSNET